MSVVDRIVAHADRLTVTERKIAAVLADEPQIFAFGTVAQVAQRAGTSGPSVIRLATKLGYDGFVGLQADVQAELALRLGPARDRIRQHMPDDLVSRIQAGELHNVSSTFHDLNREAVGRAAELLGDLDRQVWIYPGELTAPIGTVLATLLGQLRPGTTLLAGSELAIGRSLADLTPRDVVVAIDIHRYERALASTVEWAASLGASVLAITDGPLSPLARRATETFFFSARGVGPFDSMVGGVALANVIVGAVASLVRDTAADRLDAIETAWTSWRALVAEPAGPGPAPALPGIRDGQVASDGPDPAAAVVPQAGRGPEAVVAQAGPDPEAVVAQAGPAPDAVVAQGGCGSDAARSGGPVAVAEPDPAAH